MPKDRSNYCVWCRQRLSGQRIACSTCANGVPQFDELMATARQEIDAYNALPKHAIKLTRDEAGTRVVLARNAVINAVINHRRAAGDQHGA